MTTFAFITEGITDQITLESILFGHFNEEHDFNPLQPVRDATDESRQGDFAGWAKVFEFCSVVNFDDIFSVNEFVIIQIDTDICGHKYFNVSDLEAGVEKSTSRMIDDVKTFICQKIDQAALEKYGHKIFFAVSVRSLECWVLAHYGRTKSDKAKTKGCVEQLGRILRRAGIDSTKNYKAYSKFVKVFEKPETLAAAKKNNESLEIFLHSLP